MELLQVMIDAVKGTYQENYTKGQTSDAIRNALIEANGGSNKINIKNFYRGSQVYSLIEELIPTIIDEGFKDEDVIFSLVDYRNIADGDEQEFEIEGHSLFAVADAAAGIKGVRRQRIDESQKVTVKTSMKIARVYEELNRLLAGRISFDTFVDRLAKSFKQQILADAYKAIDARLYAIVKQLVDDFGENGLGLGSQISQSCALALPNKMDHYIKEDLGIKYYCRYMDDGCLIHHDKEHLKYCLQKITEICTELGIKLNPKKTQIIKLSRGINFLKTHFILTRTGKIIRKPHKKNITLMRRKLKKFKRWVEDGKMTFEDVTTSWCSWRGHQLKFNSYWARQRIHDLYVRLFYWS